jgi:4-azaleucine resistance transporter AzlC
LDNKLALKRNIHFFQGVRDCIPTLFAYISIGFACGVVCKTAGMTFIQIVGMSTFIYAGSSQFIAASMIASMASVPNIIITVFLVNLRHLLMSASAAPYFKNNSFLKNFTVGALLTDETFALASSKGSVEGNINYKWMLGVNITAYLNWILATGVGAIFGNLIPDYKKVGLDFALSAMFIGLLIASARENKKIKQTMIIILTSAAALLILCKIFSTNTAITAAAIVGALIGVVTNKWK